MILITSILATGSQANSLPDLGSPDLVEYDTQTEKELGRAFTSTLHTHYNLYSDLETNAYIRELGHKLASHTGNNRNYSFYIINDTSINAFAGPDGVIGIHTGLINATETEDELAAVIAHEISHVTQNHLSRRYEYSSTQGSLNSIASLIAAILIGMHDPSAGMATLMGGMGYNLQQQLKNSRLHESEADAIGIDLLHKSGYNPHAMGDFFGRLAKASQLDTFQVPEILRTHPVSENRLAEAENRAQNLSMVQKDKPESYLSYIKMRLKKDQSSLLEYNPQKITQNKSEACYQKTLESINTKKRVPNCIKNENDKPQSLPLFTTALIESYTTSNKKLSSQELEYLDKLVEFKLELHPNNPSIPIRYSRYLEQAGEIEKAIKILKNAESKLTYRYSLYKTLAELYAQTKQESYVYLNLAKAYLEIGSVERSEYFTKRTKETIKDNNNTIKHEITLLENKLNKLLKNKDKSTDE
ncbi:M48 family metalloprotease [Thiomicrorhabdus lithotrophica]|uniref:M48 family metalloprotease n=1 Tax=Thiomicrorhabdus lithotrophica TaxID=2949997 RepID=A0ABY8C8Y7_9GAMM|nr:M48 family metalloprotease [Thiomicrorhabdus lithotrophica]WEJ62007.1 M48 family metalloprotease [Thiomicrorhabdus lithotrophica]